MKPNQSATFFSLLFLIVSLPIIIILIPILVFLVPIRRSLKRRMVTSVNKEPLSFVFLRSFRDDRRIGQKRIRSAAHIYSTPRTASVFYNDIIKSRGKWVLEKEMSDVLDTYGLLLCMSSDRGGDVASVPSSDEKWREDVLTLMENARIIICSPGATEGTLWEIDHIFENRFESKTIFLCPGNNNFRHIGWQYGADVDPLSEEYRDWRRVQDKWMMYNFPDFDPLGAFFIIQKKNDEFTVVDRQSWGSSIGYDFMTIMHRRRLINISIWDRLRIKIYMKDRLPYFGPESQWYRDALYEQDRPEGAWRSRFGW